jgi:integrase
LSAKSINNHLTVLRRSLACAVEWELIASVPLVKWMKVPKPEFDFLTRAESERLLAAAPLEDHAIICTALKTGLRIGELLGLRWEDVDLVAGKVLVRRSAWRRNVTTPKSGKSREVPISPELHGVLSGHRHLRGPLVFCHENGSMLSRDQVKRVLPRACRLAGLRRVQWHVLRHSFASQLVMAGVPLKVVQELLGHSTIEMTMRYAHVAPDAKIDAVSVLDGPARGAQSGHHLGISRMG